MKIDISQYYSLRKNTFNPNYLSSLEMKIISSPYLSNNQLNNKSFAKTKGFSVIFNRSYISEVEQKFPFLKQYLTSTLVPKCNTFYLNALVLQKGGIVKPHIDCSISSYSQKKIITPKFVSVFYVRIPFDMEGGELVFFKKGILGKKFKVGEIKPETNALVYFNGRMQHSVKKIETSSYRISLVCEQYILNEIQLKEIPEFKIESGAYA